MIRRTTYGTLFVMILVLGMQACTVQQVALYDEPSSTDTLDHIGSYYGLNIWEDYINSEVWYSPKDTVECLQVTNVFDETAEGKGALLITWNKQAGCSWLGLGIGWDGWASKNLREIYNEAAIQFMAKSPSGNLNGLPWAMALEDYSGGQAWAGVFSSFIENNQVTEEWTRVQIPLSAFDINQFNADISIVKQLLIQFEADGSVYIDDIRLVPIEGGFTKHAEVPYLPESPEFMPSIKENNTPLELESGKVWLAATGGHLLVVAEVEDDTPLINKKKDGEIWNGDAIELAFSTNPDVYAQRKTYYLTDRHVIIRASNDPMIWDVQRKRSLNAKVIVTETTNGYKVMAMIPYHELDVFPLVPGETYGLEVAIDNSDDGSVRQDQYRWNNPGNEGFHQTPGMWGNMTIGPGLSSR
jgi:hypothetical protein